MLGASEQTYYRWCKEYAGLNTTQMKKLKALDKAQEHAEDEGIESNIVVRQGNIVQQIIAELRTQNYDLVCMGSYFSDQQDLRRHYAPNITAEVAEAVNCPVLSVRASPL